MIKVKLLGFEVMVKILKGRRREIMAICSLLKVILIFLVLSSGFLFVLIDTYYLGACPYPFTKACTVLHKDPTVTQC